MRNLLITTIGTYNHLNRWIEGNCNFDLALIDYTETGVIPVEIQSRCVYFANFQTFKYPGLYKVFKENPQLLNYDYFWLPDEDIELTTLEINKLFDKMYQYHLDLACPSIEISDTSFPSWSCFIHDVRAVREIIYINYIEVMCPVFSRNGLDRCLDTFWRSQSGWGIDLAWPKLINGGINLLQGFRNVAIINSIIARHTRQPNVNLPSIRGPLYEALFKKGIIPNDELGEMMRLYKIPAPLRNPIKRYL
jgi:hypothetical protein